MMTDDLTNFVRGTLSDSDSDGYMDTSTGSGKAWDLDVLGNWNNVTGETGDRRTNSQNEVTQVNGSTLTYDADGNLITNQSGGTLIYDAWNRLVEVNNDNGEGDYAYDALGRRIVESPVGGTTTDLYYSDQWQVIEERQSGNVTSRYVWSANYTNALVFRQQDANGNGQFDTSEQLWVTYDANYNVTSVMGVDAPMERFTYDPYGNNRVVFGSTWFPTTDAYNWTYGFQGGRRDAVTGLYNFQRRDYDPLLGRWIEQDPNPAGQYNDGANLYQFVQSNPVGNTDPAGLDTIYAMAGPMGGGGSGRSDRVADPLFDYGLGGGGWYPFNIDTPFSGGYGFRSHIPWNWMNGPRRNAPGSTTCHKKNLQPCIVCHGVSANGFNGRPNSFYGLEAIPGSGPDAMLGYQVEEELTKTFGPFFILPAAGALSEGLVGAEGIGTTVIGHYPDYVNMAESLDASYFSIPTAEWNAMTPAEQWAANERFLEEALARGDTFRLATPLDKVRPGSFLEKEIGHLRLRGCQLNDDGAAFVPPKSR